MEAVIYWNLPDGYAAFAPLGDMTAGENKYHGGVLRFDLSEKPIYRALYRLFKEEWHTDESFKTEEKIGFRGFYGEYEITVSTDATELKTYAHFTENAANAINAAINSAKKQPRIIPGLSFVCRFIFYR